MIPQPTCEKPNCLHRAKVFPFILFRWIFSFFCLFWNFMNRRNKILSPHQKIESPKVNTMKFSLESNYPTFLSARSHHFPSYFHGWKCTKSNRSWKHVFVFKCAVPYCSHTRSDACATCSSTCVHNVRFHGDFHGDNSQVSPLIQMFNSPLAHKN